MGQHIVISSEDQSMWGTGDALTETWEAYLPLIGGELTHWTATGVSVRGGLGTATLVDGEVSYTPIARGLPVGTTTVFVDVTLESPPDASGHVTSMIREVAIDVTVARAGKLGRFVTEMKSADADAAVKVPGFSSLATLRFDAVGAEELLSSPHSFTGGGPAEVVKIDINLAETILDLAKGAINAVSDVPGLLTGYVAGLADKIGVTYLADKAQEAYHATTAALKTAWDFASDRVPALRSIEAAGDAVVSGVVSAASLALDTAKDAVHAAVQAVDDLIDLGNRNISRITDWVEEGARGIFGWFSRLVTRVIETFGPTDEQQQQIEEARQVVKQEISDQAKVQRAVDAAKALSDHLGDKTVADSETELASAEKDKQDAIDALKDVFAGRDKVLDRIDKAVVNLEASGDGDAAASTDVVAAALPNISELFGGVINAAQNLNPVRLVENAVNQSNFILKATALLDVEAQAGVRLTAKIDSGSVDSKLHYDVTTSVVADVRTNSYTFTVDAVNANGTDAGFSTQSPFMTVSADILYEVKGSVDLTFDMLVTAAGNTVVDVPTGTQPFHWSADLHDAGSYTLFELDTRNIEVEIVPPLLDDILKVTFRFPNVTTTGTTTTDWRDEYDSGRKITFADFVRQSYDDPSLFDLSGLADRLLDLAKPEIGFSEMFQKFLDAHQTTIDLNSDSFGEALIKALGLIVDAAVDISLKKADGSSYGDPVENPYKDDEGYLPIFEIKNKTGSNDGLIHLDLIDNPVSDGNLAMLEKLGFFTAKGRTVNAAGEAANFLDVRIDVDQLIATAINVVVLGNSPETTINPLNLSFGLSDIFGKKDEGGGTGGGTGGEAPNNFDIMKEYLNLEASVELADLDVNAGTYLSQKFVLAVEDMEYQLLIEGDLAGAFSAAGGGSFTLPNTSGFTDKDGNGQIDYELKLAPKAELFNDTQLGINFGYNLDLLKEKLEFLVKLPPNALTGFLSALGLPTSIEAGIGLGPLLRLNGQIDLLTADVFEKAFDFNAGFGVIKGVLPPISDRSTFAKGTDVRDIRNLTTGDDKFDALGGNDLVAAGAGNDVVYGNLGDDALFGDAGDDYLSGEAGNDGLVGGPGSNTMYGGTGNDNIKDGAGNDLMDGGEGNDTLLSTAGDDTITSGSGSDVIIFHLPKVAGAMDASPLEITDFERWDPVTRIGDRLGTIRANTEAIYMSIDDIAGPDVMARFAIAPKLVAGQPASVYADLVEGGRQVLFRDIEVAELTAALQADFVLV